MGVGVGVLMGVGVGVLMGVGVSWSGSVLQLCPLHLHGHVRRLVVDRALGGRVVVETRRGGGILR